MEYKKIKIKEVKKADYNPRTISEEEKEKLKNSLKTFGCVRPLVINSQTKNLIQGHQMLDAAKDLGWEELDYIEVDLPLEKEKALNILLNRVGGVWDYDKLNIILDELKDNNYFELSGFDEIELKAINQMNNVNDLPSDEIIDMKNVNDEEKIYSLTFNFRSEIERDKVKRAFINDKLDWAYKGEPNVYLLSQLMNTKKEGNKNNKSSKSHR